MSETETKKPGRGGARSGSGPKPKPPSEILKTRTVKMTDEDWQFVLQCGGSSYLRNLIDADRILREIDRIP